MMIKKPSFKCIILVTIFGFAAVFPPFQTVATATGGDDLSSHSPKMPQTLKTLVHLYFADTSNRYLISEERVLEHPDDPSDFSRIIIGALIEGPRGQLGRTLPAETKLRALYITQNGICYVDFTPAVRELFPGGSQSELISVYSIVNSLILNVPAIDKVKILIDGKEPTTLAGHVDLTEPATANMLLIR